MYYVKKTIEVAMAHRLQLPYTSKCSSIHGHNALITIYCKARELDENGMVADFSKVSDVVKSLLDHKYVNDVVDFNPTAENLARFLCEHIANCYRVEIQESQNNVAAYERDA